MPNYEYECENCQHSFEEFQSMTDKKLIQCPKCSKNALVRLIGAGSGMIFKGSGFYETDYKKKSAPTEVPVAAPKPAAGCGGGCACHPS